MPKARIALSSSLIAIAALLGACGHPPAEVAGPKYGTFGFDTAGMDKTVKPGDDFYAYANGGWMKTTEIPSDLAGISSFNVIDIDVQNQLKALLAETAANKSAVGDEKKVADYYAAFMDETGIEARGVKPLQPTLDAIAALKDKTELSRYLGGTLRADVDILNNTDFYTDRLFGVWVTQDIDQPTTVSPYLIQGGLGMPDRDYYLNAAPRMAEMRAKYKAHIEKALTLAGQADAAKKAGDILAFETALAKIHAPNTETEDIKKGDNHWTQGDFAKKAPGMDWAAWREGAGLGAQQNFVAWQPKAVAGISALVAATPLDTWKAYLTFHAIDRAARYLPKAFADESFAFYGATLNGTPQQADRWKRALRDVDANLGEAVGKLYVAKHFSPEAKAEAEAMVKTIVAAFDKRIDTLDWMSAETKAKAHAKVATLKIGVGYPDHWRDYSAVEIRSDDPLGNAERAGLARYREQIAKLGKPAGHDEWYMLPQDVNALNMPLENRLSFPAAILQPPFFDPKADPAVNYGAIGAVIGHEISHSFDSTGALIDADGKLQNWWTPEDLKKFNAATKALAAQYDGYQPFADAHVNGELTLAENVADLGGVNAAYDAYKLSLGGKEAPAIDGFTGPQRYFLGWAQNYRTKFREPAARARLLTDGHAPGQYRADIVRNLDAWNDAFKTQPGEKLVLAPDQRVKIW